MTHIIDPGTGCWEWKKSKAGLSKYGVLSFFKKNQYVHRVSYRLLVGEIPQGMYVCHKCDNPSCFNPAHLFLGTHQDNMKDMHAKGRARKGDIFGEKNGRFKFSDEIIAEIRIHRASGFSPKEIRQIYGISNAQLWRITSGRVRVTKGASHE